MTVGWAQVFKFKFLAGAKIGNISGDSEGTQASYAYDQWPYASIGL